MFGHHGTWPGLGTAGCGMHNVNPTSNAFGNGIFDGWNDIQGSENADKCACRR
jgi:hypothetical protein